MQDILDECIQANCDFRSAAACIAIDDHPQDVTVTIKSGTTQKILQAKRVILADGDFSPLVERLGFNQNRPEGISSVAVTTLPLQRLQSKVPSAVVTPLQKQANLPSKGEKETPTIKLIV